MTHEILIKTQTKVLQGRRLVYYGRAPNVDYWSEHWSTYGHATGSSETFLGGLERPLFSYLPRQGRVLEAGCGLGQVVLSLRTQGYQIEGVEWSPETVRRILDDTPTAPVRVGDVTKLDVTDGYYRGYISLGVVEHMEQGPEPFLREASRILSSDGVALISVPYFNPLRRVKALLGFYRSIPQKELEFYQYAFSVSEFEAILSSEGFTVVDKIPYSVIKGVRDEIFGFKYLYDFGRKISRWRVLSTVPNLNNPGVSSPHSIPSAPGKLLTRLSERSPFNLAAHMMLFVCRKINFDDFGP